MQTEDDILIQLQNGLVTLLESPPSYMREINRFSHKVVSLEIKYIFFLLNKIYQLLHDSTVTIKKKLFAFRFIKDTLLLASHSFYVLTVVRILPFMVEVLMQADRKNDNGLEFLINKIAPKLEVSNSVEIKTFSTTLLQLINQIMKWTGTHVKLHPFYTIPFSSIFKLYLENFPKVKAIKMTDLTYYTTDSVNIYEQNFLQRELMSEEQNIKQAIFIDLLINNWISLPEDDEQKKGSLKLLQNIVQTGDSNFIRRIVDSLKPLIQSEITGYQAIQVTHVLLKVKQIESWVLVRDQILSSIGYYVIMMSKEKFSKLQNIDLIEILRHVFVWKLNAVKMGLKTQAFDQFFRKMKNQWIFASQSEFASKTSKIEKSFQSFQYYLSRNQLEKINEEKKKHLNLKDDQNTINKIRFMYYQKKHQSNPSNASFNQNSLHKDNQSFNKHKKSSFNQIISINQKSQVLAEQPRVTFQTIESPSPIKQLQISNIGKSLENKQIKGSKLNQEYIQFNNSLHNFSSSKQIIHTETENIHHHNIYTTKEINEDKKSSRSIRSNRSSKKSLGKLEKASSLGFGVQRVKSSKIINLNVDNLNTKSQNQHNLNSQHQPKLKILKFDESSESIRYNNVNSPRNHDSISNDNIPYKQRNSQSAIGNNNSNLIFSRNIGSKRKQLRNQQVIVVEETIKKPKFGFLPIKDDEQGTQSKSPQRIKNKKNADKANQIQEESLQNLNVDPQLISDGKLSQYSSIPSDFNAAFGKTTKGKHRFNEQDNESEMGIKFNRFPHKVKQLQMQIEKAKQYQRIYQQKMKQKDEDYQKILQTLPVGYEKIHEQNKKLQLQLQEKQRKKAEKQAIREQRIYKSPNSKMKPKQEIPFLPSKILSLGKIKPYEPIFVKQLISAKCLLIKNEIFELGYAFKSDRQDSSLRKQPNYRICLYFKFKMKCDRLEFRLVNESLIMKQQLEGKVMNIVANKQLKFEQQIVGYTLKNQDFRIPYLSLDVKADEQSLIQINLSRQKRQQPQLIQKHQIILPCTLINFLQFHTLSQKPQTIKTKYAIEAQFSGKQLTSSLKGQYLLNSFRCGKWHQKEGEKEGGFYVSLYTYVKGIRDKKLLKDRDVKVYFKELQGLERKVINLYIKKINTMMFYIESDSEFETDRIALIEISRILAR